MTTKKTGTVKITSDGMYSAVYIDGVLVPGVTDVVAYVTAMGPPEVRLTLFPTELLIEADKATIEGLCEDSK